MAGSTPIYAFPYPQPSDLVANYPALGQQLAEDIEDVLPTLGGLVPMPPSSIANSGGSASTTINTTTFSGVTSVSLNGVFTTAYDNYRVICSLSASTSTEVQGRLRVSNSDDTTSNYADQRLFATAGTISGNRETAKSSVRLGESETTPAFFVADFIAPALSVPTQFISSNVKVSATTPFLNVFAGGHNVSSVFTGFTVIAASGNISGTLSVYGYAK